LGWGLGGGEAGRGKAEREAMENGKKKEEQILVRLPRATSLENMVSLLKLGIKRRERVRLMRIGTPKEFRMEVIAAVDPGKSGLTPSCALLLDPRLPDVEFLLVDPFSEAFLERLDTEDRRNWQVLRIQQQILRFAKGLLCLAERRQGGGRLSVGFHRSGLIWNLGIVGDDLVQLRAYGKGTGHDGSVNELLIRGGKPDRLAESFIHYYESVRTRPSTRWFRTLSQFAEFERRSAWPDLFKGNAVFVPELEDKVDSGVETVGDKWKHPNVVYKVCTGPGAQLAEKEWLSLSEPRKRQCRFFHLPELWKSKKFDWRGEALVVAHAGSCSLFELASAVQALAARGAADSDRAAVLLGVLVSHSLEALKEFRAQNECVGKNIKPRVYPYAGRLTSAFETTKLFLHVVSRSDLERAMEEARALGQQLEAAATAPFRDAHLKNRLLMKWNVKPEELARTLLDTPTEKLSSVLDRQIVDIDFETAQYLVTDLDDYAHVLFFENTGLSPLRFKLDAPQVLAEWAGLKDVDEHLLRQTMLARATREYLRRLWYARTMPATYMARYALESRDYFLDLALWAAERLSSWVKLKSVLETIKEHADAVWDMVPARTSLECIEARFIFNFRFEFHASISAGREGSGADNGPTAPGGSKGGNSSAGKVFVVHESTKNARFLGSQMMIDPADFDILVKLCRSAGVLVPQRELSANINQIVSKIRKGMKDCVGSEVFLTQVRRLVKANRDTYTRSDAAVDKMDRDELAREFLKVRNGVGYRLHVDPSDVDIFS